MNASGILRRLGRDTQYVLLGFPLGIVAFVLAFILLGLGIGLSVVWVGVPLLMLMMLVMRGLAALERVRIGAVFDRPLPQPAYKRPSRPGFLRRALTPLSDGQSWLDLVHAMLRFIPSTIAFSFVLTWWVGALGGLSAPLWDGSVKYASDNTDLSELIGVGNGTVVRVGIYMVVGLFFTLTLYPVVRGAALLEAGFARGLLNGVAQLREQVVEAQAARDVAQAQKAAAVSAEAIALRRLERDIHDGPQQRLIRLAMDLGRAEQQFDSDPEKARATVAEALAQTRETLDELRALSRGIAPPILVDRGLSAALTALAGRCTVPVELDLPEIGRLDPATESTAYFVVAEALTNVAKHSQAGEVRVALTQNRGHLWVEVVDDGIGGASLAKGHGLAGLDDRVRAAGGVLSVQSVDGTGTLLRASLPV